MENSSDENIVTTTLNDLRVALDEEKQRLNEQVAEAMKDGEYNTAAAVIQFAQHLLGFQNEAEALFEKWEVINEFRDQAIPQVQNIVRSPGIGRTHVTNPPAVRLRSNLRIEDSILHCFHILDVLNEMGGRAENQKVSAAVNKRVKMLYPKFKLARVLMAEKGWTKKIGSNHILEISNQGIRWLESQKLQSEESPRKDHLHVPEAAPSVVDSRPDDDENGPFI